MDSRKKIHRFFDDFLRFLQSEKEVKPKKRPIKVGTSRKSVTIVCCSLNISSCEYISQPETKNS
jgi:hypothetical protein